METLTITNFRIRHLILELLLYVRLHKFKCLLKNECLTFC